MFSKYINSEYIAANSADIKKLNTDVANINSAIIGTSSTETGIVFNLSSANAKFDSAWIINGIAGKMTIGDLAAGDITISDTMRILSENGNFIMNGSAMQFLDKEGNVGIQIGYDTEKNPSIIIKDDKGATIMTSQGITKDAIADGLIVNNMLSDGSITENKLGFRTVKPNAQGGIDIDMIYDGKGGLWGDEYTSFKESVNSTLDDWDSKMDEMGYEIFMTTSAGRTLGRGINETVATAHLSKDGQDITDDWDESHFIWKRESRDISGDYYLNEAHKGKKQITITRDDIYFGAAIKLLFVVDGETVASTN